MPTTISPSHEYVRLLTALGCPQESRDHLAAQLTTGTYQTALLNLSIHYPQLANLSPDISPEAAIDLISRTATQQEMAASLLEAVKSISQELIHTTLPRLPISQRQIFLDYLKSELLPTNAPL